jgi:hypothetical protein
MRTVGLINAKKRKIYAAECKKDVISKPFFGRVNNLFGTLFIKGLPAFSGDLVR